MAPGDKFEQEIIRIAIHRRRLQIFFIIYFLFFADHEEEQSGQRGSFRSVHSDRLRGVSLTNQFLFHGGGDRLIRDLFRMGRDTFYALANCLKRHTSLSGALLSDPNHVSVEQRVLIFLYVTCQGHTFRDTCMDFQHSNETVSRAFHEGLKETCAMYRQTVSIPSFEESCRTLMYDRKSWQYFRGCLAALDGTHIPVRVPAKKQTQWRNRKGAITQNVLAACDFSLNFRFIASGLEGSRHDSNVLHFAIDKGLDIPRGCFFLADAGYSTRNRFVLVPYSGTRYHLKEFGGRSPVNSKEIFNMRHAKKRSAIERTFAMFKRRLAIFNNAREQYSVKTQANLVFTLAWVDNFMNGHHESPEDLLDGSDEEG